MEYCQALQEKLSSGIASDFWCDRYRTACLNTHVIGGGVQIPSACVEKDQKHEKRCDALEKKAHRNKYVCELFRDQCPDRALPEKCIEVPEVKCEQLLEL